MARKPDIESAAASLKYAGAVHVNVEQEIIIVTRDKVQICLMRHVEHLGARQAWIAPAGLLASISLAFATSKFQDSLGLKADTWQAVFVCAGFTSAVWLLVCLGKLASARRKGINEIVAEMKAEGLSPAAIPQSQVKSIGRVNEDVGEVATETAAEQGNQ